MTFSLKISFEKIIYFLICPFFVWSFLGGHKQVVYGVSTDHVMTMLAFFASILISLRYKIHGGMSKNIIFIYFIYLLVSILSFIFGEIDINSIYIIATGCIYFFITLSFSFFFLGKEENFFKIIIFSSVFSSLVLIISFIFLGMGAWGRLTIPVFYEGKFEYFPMGYESSSDPNVLAYFLGFGLITSIFLKRDGIFSFSSVVIFIGMCLTLSRSAFLSMLMVFVLYLFYILNKSLKDRILIKLSILGVVMIFVLYISYHLNMYDLLLSRIYSEESNSDRVERISMTIDFILDPVVLLFGSGVGFSRDNIDPHNFYLSTIQDTGLFSLLLVMLMPLLLTFSLMRKNVELFLRKYSVSLVVFFCVISMFYWQMRTYYFLILILIILNNNKISDKIKL